MFVGVDSTSALAEIMSGDRADSFIEFVHAFFLLTCRIFLTDFTWTCVEITAWICNYIYKNHQVIIYPNHNISWNSRCKHRWVITPSRQVISIHGVLSCVHDQNVDRGNKSVPWGPFQSRVSFLWKCYITLSGELSLFTNRANFFLGTRCFIDWPIYWVTNFREDISILKSFEDKGTYIMHERLSRNLSLRWIYIFAQLHSVTHKALLPSTQNVWSTSLPTNHTERFTLYILLLCYIRVI